MEWGINYWRGRSLIVVMRGLSWGFFFFFLINHGGLISYEEGIVQSSKCEVKNQNLCLLQVGSRTMFLIALYAMLGGSLTLFCVARLPSAHLLF